MKNDADEYWRAIGRVASDLGCRSRFKVRDSAGGWTSSWGMLLTVPETGYLEVEGPMPTRDVEWVELSTMKLYGGLGDRPLTQRDITEELTTKLNATGARWEFRDTTWTVRRVLIDAPVRVVHIPNPYLGHD